MKDKQIGEIKDAVISIVKKKHQKPLSELEYLLDMRSENLFTSKNQKYSDKIENWFKSHNNIPACEIPHTIMKKINSFDIGKYGKIKLRFQGERML